MNATQNTSGEAILSRPADRVEVSFAIVAGAMQYNGAWAQTQKGCPQTEDAAREYFSRHPMVRPPFGHCWSVGLALVRRSAVYVDGKYVRTDRETIAQRNA